jgi:acyl-CoA dehydrogenase
MPGPTSEAMAQFRASVRRVVEAEVAPHVDAWEADGVPADLIARAGELGWLGLSVPEADGGQGADLWADAILLEEVARVSMSAATTLAVQTDLLSLRLAGTDTQRSRWLAPALAGQVTVAVAVTDLPDDDAVDAADHAPDQDARTTVPAHTTRRCRSRLGATRMAGC